MNHNDLMNLNLHQTIELFKNTANDKKEKSAENLTLEECKLQIENILQHVQLTIESTIIKSEQFKTKMLRSNLLNHLDGYFEHLLFLHNNHGGE